MNALCGLEELGITKDVIRDRIVDVAIERLIAVDGEVAKIVRDRTDVAIAAITERIGNETVAPKVAELIEGLTFQKTNNWGEPKEPAKTWRELLLERAETWLIEPVNYQGKTKREDSYNWSKSTTRIAYLIDKHLQYEIEKVMKAALMDANNAILKGIHEAVRIKLNELGAAIKVTVVAK